jgi:hypothetical protein
MLPALFSGWTLQPDSSIVQAGTTSGDFAPARYTTSGQLDLTF